MKTGRKKWAAVILGIFWLGVMWLPGEVWGAEWETASSAPPAVSSPSEATTEETLMEGAQEQIQLPEDASRFMQEHDIRIDDPAGTMQVTPGMVFSYLWEELCHKLASPLRMLGGLLTVIFLAALLNGVGDTAASGNLSRVYGMITALVCVGFLAGPVSACMQTAANTLQSGGTFLISYVPVFSSIVAASGNITSAGAYSAVVLAAAEIFTQVAGNILMPLLGLCLATGTVEAMNPAISLSGLADAMKRICSWGIGILLTIFVGLLTIQSVIGTSADSIAIRAGKYVVSSMVPVVGGALSEAYTTIKGSLGLLRGGVGIFGIIAMVAAVLPGILEVLAVQIAIGIGRLVADLCGVKAVSGFLKSASSALSMTMGILLAFLMALIISTAIMMMMGMHML